jgi:hypothetical protein
MRWILASRGERSDLVFMGTPESAEEQADGCAVTGFDEDFRHAATGEPRGFRARMGRLRDPPALDV